jgi:hypothetical protein
MKCGRGFPFWEECFGAFSGTDSCFRCGMCAENGAPRMIVDAVRVFVKIKSGNHEGHEGRTGGIRGSKVLGFGRQLFFLHFDCLGDVHGLAGLSADFDRASVGQVGCDGGGLGPIQIPSVFDGQ